MWGKRCRNAGSSTQHATPLETDASDSLRPAKVMKPSGAHAAQQLQPKILNAVSPAAHQSAGAYDWLKMRDFQGKCHYCLKQITQNSEVFMYSNLCANCSAERRSLQIARDQWLETQSVNPQEKIVPGINENGWSRSYD